MSPIIPVLGKDRLLSVEEAEKRMKEANIIRDSKGEALLNLVKKGKVRCWLCSDGELRFQAATEMSK